MIYDIVALKNQTEHEPKEYAINLTIKLTINNYKLWDYKLLLTIVSSIVIIFSANEIKNQNK